MTQQFRPGQRVRVVGHLKSHRRDLMPIGTVCVVGNYGCTVGPRTGGGWIIESGNHIFEIIPEPGIPAHLVRTPLDDACRHWPVWRA